DVLTVGIVTMPFQFEGVLRCKQAQAGIERLRSNVDSLIVINNNKLREVYGNLGFKAGFSKADEVLATAARGIAEVITHHYTQNIDLRDAKTVLSDSGTAIMGSSTASGATRAHEAITRALDSPLLNDNKIKGAKNVLLLIVSGSQEITIDEIGEINDHIQIEAGHGANIIMGVGEDENLGEAIAVTVIATGFDMDQQDEIVNTETKKIIHTLEDEQKAVHDLSASAPAMSFDLDEPIEEPVIKHTLEEEPEKLETEEPESELIPTTNNIRNFYVFYEEVKPEQVDEVLATNVEEDFVIIESKTILNDIDVVDPEVVSSQKGEEDQFALTFDMPLNDTADKEEDASTITFDLDEEVKEVEVQEYIEVAPVIDFNKKDETRYNLEEYMELETQLTGARSVAETHEPKLVEDELIFEKRTVNVDASSSNDESTSNNIDPFNSSINDLLRDRVNERKRKLKNFNYTFKNSRSIEEKEKEPAYKRQGVDLEGTPQEDKVSRTSVSEDSNEEIQLRSTNSFLHDNVD
ncbi:MAG: cell division protein FtsZ, partial [Croceitalea sp.]|nr:cell division protein FtsZ [Croceitalea sp.]